MRTRDFILLFYLIDLVLLNVAIVFIAYVFGLQGDFNWPFDQFVIFLNLCWSLTYLIFIDDMQHLKANFWNLLKVLNQRFVAFFAISAGFFILFGAENFSREMFLGSNFLFGILKILLSAILYYKMSLSNNVGKSPILIVGDNKIGNKLFRYCIDTAYLGYNPIGILAKEENDLSGPNVIGHISQFQEIYDKNPFNDVIISIPTYEKELIKELVFVAERNGVRPRIMPNWSNVLDRDFIVGTMGKVPLLDIRRVPLYRYPNRFWKRAFDLLFSSLIIIPLLPLFAFIAILIKLDSKGPVFYKPTRLGVNGKPFTVYKFRSMKHSDDAQAGTRSTVLNDTRVTKLGKFLRKSNLDELPQLFNVIKNEMSIVGPRPHRVHLNQTLQKKMGSYMVRHFIKPGITGWAQVNGWRGPTETKMQYTGRTLHDIWYIENWTFWLDIYIMFMTFFGKKVKKNAF